MHGSAAVGWLLAALCAFVAGVCLLRARGAGGMRRRTARSEALMGLGMAAMALPGSASAALSPLVFVVLFGAVGVREVALLREARRPDGRGGGSGQGQARQPRPVHHLHHIVGALAMSYMALAMQAPHGAGAAGGGHAGAAGLPLLTAALLVYYAGYVLRTGLRLLPAPAGGVPTEAAARRPGGGAARCAETADPCGGSAVDDVPGLAAACRVAMGTGMLGMLLML